MSNTQPTPPSGELRATGTLDIKDSRTDKSYSVQILQGGVEGDTAMRAMDLRQIKVDARRVRPDDIRPGVHEHGVVQERDHVHRRRQGHPALPRLSRSSSSPRRRASSRSRGCCATASCPTRSNTTSGRTTSRTTRTCTRTSRRSCRASATTRTRCRCCCSAVAALSSFYPDAKNIHDPESALHQHRSPAGEAADARGVLLTGT